MASVHFTLEDVVGHRPGQPIVTSPAPTRDAASAARAAAPVLPSEPATIRTWPKVPLWPAAGRSGRRRPASARVHTSARISASGRRIGDPDARNADRSREGSSRLEHETELREPQGEGDVGTHRLTQDPTGIRAHNPKAGRSPRPVRRSRGPPGSDGMLAAAAPSNLAIEARAEDRIHHHAAPGRRTPALALDLHAERLGPTPVVRGVAAQIRWIPELRRPHRHAGLVQMPCNHPSVAAVVARTAHDDHGLIAFAQREHRLDDGAPGALHQRPTGHPERLDRVAIQGAHLRRRNEGPGRRGSRQQGPQIAQHLIEAHQHGAGQRGATRPRRGPPRAPPRAPPADCGSRDRPPGRGSGAACRPGAPRPPDPSMPRRRSAPGRSTRVPV